MQFGLSLIVRGKDANRLSVRTLAEYAEQHGYASVWSSDHIVIPPVVNTRFPGHADWRFPPHWLDGYLSSLAVLTYVAAMTERVLVGTSALVLPLRNPIELAKHAATTDVLSEGRLVLAVAAGYAQDEFDVLGASFHDRGARTDEYIRICRTMWTHDPASFAGRFYSFDGIHTGPRPVRRPHPPIFVGGWSKAAIARAARLGDGWHPASVPPERLAVLRDELRRALDAEGRSPEMPIWLKSAVSFGGGGGPEVVLAGGPREMVATIHRYERLGVEHIVLDWCPETLTSALATLDRFEREVRPWV